MTKWMLLLMRGVGSMATVQAAAYRGETGIMRLLLDKGADFNARDGKYGAALKKMLTLEPVRRCRVICLY